MSEMATPGEGETGQQLVHGLRRGFGRRGEAGRIERADFVVREPGEQGAPGAGGESGNAVADRSDDAQGVTAGMGGDADDLAAAPDADIAGMPASARSISEAAKR